jgi:hypothetical protein
VALAPASVRDWKILDPAVGSGHFLVVALGLLLALFQEEARHRGLQDTAQWSDQAIVEYLLAHTLHGIDIDPRAVQISAASLWLKGKSLCPENEPEQLNLVAPNLRLADLPDDDPALVELRSDIEAETGIAGEFTSQILQALRGADHLGSLLKIDQAVDAAIDQQERRVKALRTKALQVQADLFGGAPPVQEEIDFSPADARADLQELLEKFLIRHSSANDLGLRLNGEQLASGVRFARMLIEKSFDLVIANPPYQGTGKMSSTRYVEECYPLGKNDLYGAFLLRGLELCRPSGFSCMLTMRGWMFIKQYEQLRSALFANTSLRAVGDFAIGAFEEVSNDLLSVAATLIQTLPGLEVACTCQMPVSIFEPSYDRSRTLRKRAAVLGHEGIYRYNVADSSVVPGWPAVYWWTQELLHQYKVLPLVGNIFEIVSGIKTGDDVRFVREINETPRGLLPHSLDISQPASNWQPFVNGADGAVWIEPTRQAIKWRNRGLELMIYGCYCAPATVRLRDSSSYYRQAVPFAMIGSSFSARAHRHPCLFGSKGASILAEDIGGLTCLLNSSDSRQIMESLSGGLDFHLYDIQRLPVRRISDAEKITKIVSACFSRHESCRESSIEFRHPGASPWRHAQEWAQQAVDRPECAPLPEYIE